MSRVTFVVSLVVIVLLAAGTATAQVGLLANRAVTGNVTDTFTATSSGNNSDQCVTPEQFGNSGPQQNTQGIVQDTSFSGDLSETGPDGSTGGFNFAPVLTAPCDQKVEQSSAATSNP